MGDIAFQATSDRDQLGFVLEENSLQLLLLAVAKLLQLVLSELTVLGCFLLQLAFYALQLAAVFALDLF
jgi:hypothetical protein